MTNITKEEINTKVDKTVEHATPEAYVDYFGNKMSAEELTQIQEDRDATLAYAGKVKRILEQCPKNLIDKCYKVVPKYNSTLINFKLASYVQVNITPDKVFIIDHKGSLPVITEVSEADLWVKLAMMGIVPGVELVYFDNGSEPSSPNALRVD